MKSKPSLLESYAIFADQFRLQDAPEATVEYTRLLTLDLLGCAIGGLKTSEDKAARAACKHMDGGIGASSLWGTGLRASPRNAAMFNGIISHVLELDDFLGIDHTGAVVIPALFAVMELEDDFDEDRFLEAMILAYELGRRMLDTAGGYSKHNSVGWHTTGTLGSYTAAAAIGKYLKLNPAQLISAIGLAGSVTGGTWAFSADGAMSKRLHPGVAAQNGIMAAFMARSGFNGPKHVLEADWGGYFKQFAPNHECNLSSLFSELGEDFRIGWVGIKPYACCRGCHSAIDVMHQMRIENSVTFDSVETVLVTCSSSQYRQLGSHTPTTIAEAQLSLPFSIASALRFDSLGTNRFSEKAFNDPVTLALTQKVKFDVKPDWPLGKEPEFQVTLLDGTQFSGFVAAAKGDPSNPVPLDTVIDKFQQLVSGRLGQDDQKTLINFGLSRDNRPTLKTISELLGREINKDTS